MKVVFVTGTWDLFHIGHLRMLQRAKSLGGRLVVGVVTDGYAQTYKDKPVIPFDQRFEIVRGVRYVDAVVSHHAADETDHIVELGVSVRVVGPEFGELQGQRDFLEWAKEHGVEVVVLPRTPNISTTMIKERIRNG